jgi:FkbM family methyltransferase
MSHFFRTLDVHSLRDYSQQGEQAIIARFFEETKATYSPFFVDVGAFDGVTGSNSRFLAELGWGGIVIEPTPGAFAALESLYQENAAVTCIRCAVSDYAADDVEMLVAEGPAGVPDEVTWHYSQVSTLNSALTHYYVEQHGYRYRPVSVRVRPLTEILRANGCPLDFAFLSIDCEGEDLRIIQELDYAQFQPRLLSLECDDNNRFVFERALHPRGYIEYERTACNTLFQRRS